MYKYVYMCVCAWAVVFSSQFGIIQYAQKEVNLFVQPILKFMDYQKLYTKIVIEICAI